MGARIDLLQPLTVITGEIDQSPCNGCTSCRHRCTAGIDLTEPEYTSIRTYLAEMEPAVRDPILAQDKQVPWPGAEEEASYEACRFHDLDTGLCLVYPVRPLICRLFGFVEWLPCPIEKVGTVWAGGPEAMRSRAPMERKTWEEWAEADLTAS